MIGIKPIKDGKNQIYHKESHMGQKTIKYAMKEQFLTPKQGREMLPFDVSAKWATYLQLSALQKNKG